MDKDLNNFKKWFKNLGLEIDGKIDDQTLKKMLPPQRLDMWRNIIRHVLPKEEVELIKKSILLHKLQKRQKPLMAKVETDKDLANALKYEELLAKYNKIQKEIVDVKIINSNIKTDLNEKNEYKKNLIKSIELKQNKCYIAKHKTEYYNKFIEMLNDTSNVCKHFSTEANEVLTKTDYEDSLIKCFTEVDDAKQAGIMNDGVNIQNNLFNVIYTTICDKSPAILLQTVEENIMHQIKKSNDLIIEAKETTDHSNSGNENLFNELIVKLFQKQLELKLNLSKSLTEKECVINRLKEITHLVKNEITSQYKLKNISCTDGELLAFKENLKEALQTEIENSINCPKVIGFRENIVLEEETFKMLDDIFEKTNSLNEEIGHKRIIICEMLKELNDKKSDFGLMEVASVMDSLAEDYSKKISKIQPVNKMITSINNISSFDADNINKFIIRSTPKSSAIHFRTLQAIKQHSEMIDVIDEIKTKFEEFSGIISVVNNINDITQKECLHKSEFDSIKLQIENNMLELDSNIEGCKLIADTVLNSNWIQHLLPEK